VEGHGLEPSEIARVFEQSEELFALSKSEKECLSDKTMSRGYTNMQNETLDPAHQTEGDTKEGYYIGRDIPINDPRYNPMKLRGPNQWPDPEALPHFRPVMENYHDKASKIGLRLVQLMAKSLGLDESYFDKDFAEPVATLRLLHYDKRQSEPEKGIYACGAHSDYGMATLLLTDEHPGLQIYHKGEWIDVPPRPHSFVVNLGDMLQIWTNGRYKSTLHRVLTSSEYERYSIPFFYDPHFETVVDCLPTCTSDNNPPKYTSTTAGQHLVSKYKETHADFAPEK
jgi:isopenicillin N synthase-like dioxygenase